MNPISKLILGTVQFGLEYGINNETGRIHERDAFEIMEACSKAGILMLDTASAYGQSEEIIGQYQKSYNHKFNVISKLIPGIQATEVGRSINQSIEKIGSSLNAILFHSFADFARSPEDFLHGLEVALEAGHIQKYGISLYTKEELEWLMNNRLIPPVIQIPFSALNREFEPYLDMLKEEYETEVHVRSVFLQGLYFMETEHIPSFLSGIIPALNEMYEFTSSREIDYLSFLLSFPFLDSRIDGVILGVDSIAQLREIIAAVANLDARSLEFKYSKVDQRILNPSNWNSI